MFHSKKPVVLSNHYWALPSSRMFVFALITVLLVSLNIVFLVKGENLFEKFKLQDRAINYDSLGNNNFKEEGSYSSFFKRMFSVYIRPNTMFLFNQNSLLLSPQKFDSLSKTIFNQN
ncbi:hypothetical protein MSU_0685 [Mycoplasma suis str. Illinois]|uniref:Uncharacterized protein n=1 Tax=Mycoplasma suis (strain Illinois) TaxID=768700 RepID=F0QRU6_MYCSL|nr:hypothetical protein MSU_0685 [Mycoplasma suis str. Illinois]